MAAVPIVRTRNGPFSADNVILANNAFARRLGFLRSRLVTIYTYAGVTPVLDAAQQALLGQRDQWGVIPANRLGTTLRRIRGGRFMVRSAYSYEAEQPLERMAGQLRASFQRRYPQLAAHDFEYVWSGSTALTGNGASFVGEVRPGLYAAVGCNGAGVIKGTIHGRLLAERIAGQRSAMLDDLEALEKPNWLPPDPLRRIGVLTAIACQVRKAGLEVEGQRGQSAGRFRKSAGFRISIPWNGCSSSRSLSPVRIIRASPFRAISRNLSSLGSRHAVMRCVMGMTRTMPQQADELLSVGERNVAVELGPCEHVDQFRQRVFRHEGKTPGQAVIHGFGGLAAGHEQTADPEVGVDHQLAVSPHGLAIPAARLRSCRLLAPWRPPGR